MRRFNYNPGRLEELHEPHKDSPEYFTAQWTIQAFQPSSAV